MLRQTLSSLLVAATLTTLAPASLAAQIRASERGSVSQTIDGTTMTVAYARPAVHERALFGELVPYDSPWTGANWATTFEADRDVRLNGTRTVHGVPPSFYSLDAYTS